MSTLADVCGVALGLSFLFAILVEVCIAMVLFAPMLKKRWFDQGREEGRKEGREQGREEMRQKYAELEAWRQRKEEAEANNQPFDEPRPSL